MTPGNGTGCVLRERRSRFIEIFRTTPTATVCPNFYVLSHANGCAFRPQCDYCYLKSTFWRLRAPEAFSNLEAMIREVRQWQARDGLESYVLNAGNLSDSLAFEEARPLVSQLVEVFREAESAGRPHALLLVTKGGLQHSSTLLQARPSRNVIVSFSVTSPAMAAQHERGAATVADRLEAARQLGAAGWRVRLRIDPMFLGADYRELAHEVRELAPERVTLGSLRAEPHLLRVIGDGLFSDLEKPTQKSALARYPLAARLELYRPAVEILRGSIMATSRRAGMSPCHPALGLCEETRDVWDALGLDADAKSCNCGS